MDDLYSKIRVMRRVAPIIPFSCCKQALLTAGGDIIKAFDVIKELEEEYFKNKEQISGSYRRLYFDLSDILKIYRGFESHPTHEKDK